MVPYPETDKLPYVVFHGIFHKCFSLVCFIGMFHMRAFVLFQGVKQKAWIHTPVTGTLPSYIDIYIYINKCTYVRGCLSSTVCGRSSLPIDPRSEAFRTGGRWVGASAASGDGGGPHASASRGHSAVMCPERH